MGTSAKGDRQILRDLGLQVAEIAALDQLQTTKGLWTVLNGLGREGLGDDRLDPLTRNGRG